MKPSKALWAIFATFLLTIGTLAWAGQQDFQLINRTGFDIYAVYVSPSGVDDWREDVLGTEYLLNGGDITITFDGDETTRFWDISVQDSDGESLEFYKIDLKQAYQVILEPHGEARIK